MLALVTAVIALTGLNAAHAGTIFEDNEGGPGGGATPLLESRHATTGPVLADDFVPVAGGRVDSVTWWGSQANQNDLWEVTFHGNSATNQPDFPVIGQDFLTGLVGADPDGDGIFEFSANWTLPTVFAAGSQNWFSVANGTAGWLWAFAGQTGPQVGSENFDALVSVGGAPSIVAGPHDGPWALPTCPLCGANVNADLAFRINAVPVPAALPLFASALLGFGLLGRRRMRKQVEKGAFRRSQ